MKIFGRIFILLVFFSLTNFLNPMAGVPQESPPADLVEEARKLYGIEEDYFQKRIKSEWQSIYNYQHPDYRKTISLEEFKFFDGKVLHNYIKSHTLSISGKESNTRDFIRRNQEKKDVLGFPAPRKYQMFNDPLYTLRKYDVYKVSISKDGKYAKTHYKADVDTQYPPELWRGYMRYKFVLDCEDFWEKVDGNWFITVLKNKVSASGGPTFAPYFIPNNSDAWEKTEFVDIDVDVLLPKTATGTTPEKSQN